MRNTSLTLAVPQALDTDAADAVIEASRRRVARWGAALVLFGVVGLGGWAAFSPISSAALAPGVVKVAGERKSVQHLEGGIVREIRVREDQRVSAGEVLLQLDDVAARSRHDALAAEHDALAAEFARWQAEREGRERIVFDDALESRRADPVVARLLDGESRLHASRRAALAGQLEVLGQRQQQAREKIGGRRTELAATRVKLGYIAEEIAGAQSLLDSGMYLKTRYFALRRAEADLQADIGRAEADIAEASALISETALRMSDLRNQQRREADDRIQDLRARLRESAERLEAAAAVLARTRVVAPLPGTVIGLQAHTTGGVIRPGATILEIVPTDAPLVVEARIQPEDIDRVRQGMAAEVRFTAFNRRTIPVFPGSLTRVSADRLTDPARGQAYYLAQVQVDTGGRPDLVLQAGMPAEVYIVTGERTVLDYLVRPIREQMRRGMLER